MKVTGTIGRADNTITAPKAKTLTYTGEEQALVTAGSVTNGTMVYSLSQDGTYNTTIPVGTNAGTYQVWYNVIDAGGNYVEAEPASVEVTIKKAKPVVTAPVPKTLTYNGYNQELVTPGYQHAVNNTAEGVTLVAKLGLPWWSSG